MRALDRSDKTGHDAVAPASRDGDVSSVRNAPGAAERFKAMLRPDGFVRAVGVLATGTIVGQLITLAASPILSRLFDPASFGVLAVYTAVLGVATTIGSLRLEQAIGLPRSQQVAFNVMVLAVMTSVVTATVVGALAFVAPGWLFPATDVDVPALVSLLLPLGVLFGSIYQAMSIWALRTRAFQPVAITRVSQAITAAVAQIGAGILGLGAVGLTAGHALGQSVGAGTLIARTLRGRRLRRPRRRDLWLALKRYKRFPLLATPAALLNSVSLQVPVILLASAFGSGATGQYYLSLRITMAPLDVLGRSVGQVFYADAIKLGRSQPRALRRLVIATSIKSVLIGIIPTSVIAIFSPYIFPILFGADWHDAGLFSRATAVMLLANFAVSPVSQIFLLVEKQMFSVIVNLVKLITALTSVLIPIALGATAVGVVWVFSWAMAGYYIAVLVTALTMLGRMKSINRETA